MIKKITPNVIMYTDKKRDGNDPLTKIYTASKINSIKKKKNKLAEVISKKPLDIGKEKIQELSEVFLREYNKHKYFRRLKDFANTDNYLILVKKEELIMKTDFDDNDQEKPIDTGRLINEIIKPILETISEMENPLLTLNPLSLFETKKREIFLDIFSVPFRIYIMSKKIKEAQSLIEFWKNSDDFQKIVYFIAPEILEGELKDITKADSFSIGSLLYYFLSKGKVPFDQDVSDVNLKERNTLNKVKTNTVLKKFRAFFERSLRTKPEDRFSPKELIEILEQIFPSTEKIPPHLLKGNELRKY
jgi:serine/threonine protein kinase